VFRTLREGTALDDARLDTAIRTVADLAPDAARRARARRLFAVALETPGGLKVQTIHAFCTRVLHQFPFEANVAARFDVLDEAAESQLLADISLGVFLEAAQHPDGALGRALEVATAEVADRTFKEVVGEAIRKRDAVERWIRHGGGMEAAVAGLCGALGIAGNDTIEQVEKEMVEGPFLPSSTWAAAAEMLARGSKNDREQAERLQQALAATASERAGYYVQFFLTSASEPRQRLITKAFEADEPGLAARIESERPRMLALIERRKAVACRDRTAALLAIADAVISRYQAAKARRGLLDYDDLIDKALVLLSEDRAAWVHYKLDQGIDHVLIDEAQDTSPKQWEIVRLLTAEFFAGAGARAVKRTIFAVGDEKQSIFSFQDAAPRAFAEMRGHFRSAHAAAELPFVPREFKHSFRSGPNVLGAVDTVFGPKDIYVSVTSDADGIPPHLALPDAAPGLVEIWDTLKPEKKPEIEAWDAPFDELTETSTQQRLATKIAKNVKRWTQQGAGAGDVLVLVRQRGALFEAIIRALKEQRIPVAGADRLVLTEHIAVMDLMVLADALLLPDDDLALATALKSPLLGLDDEDLFEIAWQRRGSLRTALREKAQSHEHFAKAAATLDRFAEWARQPPFAFYAHVLGAERGRQRFLARLGPEVDDALDEFLNLALDYERRETPSLQGFVAWLRAAQTNVKRDMEITRQEVRVMTVHGAKGLEAPIVILADTTTEPAGPVQRQPKLITLAHDGVPGNPDRFVWGRAKATDVAPVAAAREQVRREAEDEHRRLLYVAMTRAIDRLIVCGAEGLRRPQQGCWWNLVAHALQPVSVEEPADDGEGNVWRYRKVPASTGKGITLGEPDAPTAADAVPDWLRHDAPADPAPVQPLTPSSAYDEEVPVRRRGAGDRAEREKAKTRGVLLHRLLQSLPDIPREARAEAARRHVARNGKAFGSEECEAMVEEVLRVLDDPRFSELFLPGSRAEVPIVGRLALNGRAVPVSGLVDRLAVTTDSVLIADYKTNRPAPRRPEDVPTYVTQLALYRALLAQLYPGKSVRAALIWTDVPDLMELSGAALDAALTRVTSL
jgi:ATP-dependent helicase/nuclease subunit A